MNLFFYPVQANHISNIRKDRLHDGKREDMSGIYATNSIHDELKMGRAVKEKI